MRSKNRNLIYSIILAILTAGCGVQNAKFFSSIQKTDDITYGYTAENPIKIKNTDLGKSINSSYYYISRLRTEEGKELELIVRYSTSNPNYVKPKIPLKRIGAPPLNYGNGPLLDKWVLLGDSEKDTIIIYTNPYDKGEVMVPKGLTFQKESDRQHVDLTPPNFGEIKANIENEKSKYYYPKLLERFEQNDTSLNKQDYRHLYFGYIFHDKYEPDWLCNCQDSLLIYYQKESLNQQDCDSIIKYAKICLAENPFDIRQMNMLAYAYHLNGEEEKAIPWATKTQNLIGTILSTGTGKKNTSAIYVIFVSHEYEVLKAIGLFPNGQSLVKMKYDYINVQKNQFRIKGLYFNIEKIFDARMRKT